MSQIISAITSVASSVSDHFSDSITPGFDPIIGNPFTGADPVITPTGNWTPEVWQGAYANGGDPSGLALYQAGNAIADKIAPAIAGGAAFNALAGGAGAAGEGIGYMADTGGAAGANLWATPMESFGGGIGYMADTGASAGANLFTLGDAGVTGIGALNDSMVSSIFSPAVDFGASSLNLMNTISSLQSPASGFDWGSVQSAQKFAGQGKSILDSVKNYTLSEEQRKALANKQGGGLFSTLGNVANLGSSIYGMTQQAALRKQAELAAAKGDSWGASGGRSLADSQLQQLMANPRQVSSNDPSYALRIQGAQRATAGMGQDSGAMAVAGANASTSWYNDRLAQLSGLAGAGGTGAQSQSLGMQGNIAANDLASKSLASLGYGISKMNGVSDMPPDVLAYLQARGMV